MSNKFVSLVSSGFAPTQKMIQTLKYYTSVIPITFLYVLKVCQNFPKAKLTQIVEITNFKLVVILNFISTILYSCFCVLFTTTREDFNQSINCIVTDRIANVAVREDTLGSYYRHK